MTIPQDRLEELATRVRAATGPDRELDAAIREAIDHKMMERQLLWRETLEYTASIDEALTLVERVLPGWKRQFFEKRGGAGWVARVSSPRYDTFSSGEDDPMPNAPLAILSACISALIEARNQ